ncbi:unnamed protein product [Effrenium voratum]|nr:unnamed protein product [Effrenium voratum]
MMQAEHKPLRQREDAERGAPSPGLYGTVKAEQQWMKGAAKFARWLETSEDTDPVKCFTVCCTDFKPRRVKAPVVLAWLLLQALGLIFQVILFLEIGRNLESFEESAESEAIRDTLAANCDVSKQQSSRQVLEC